MAMTMAADDDDNKVDGDIMAGDDDSDGAEGDENENADDGMTMTIAMARWAIARWDTMTTTMATGNN